MKIKTNEATGPVLDWLVAEGEGLRVYYNEFDEFFRTSDTDKPYWPAIDWSQGGPIIERQGITITDGLSWNPWHACMDYSPYSDSKWVGGDTPLIAAMRCYVASKLGEEVEVPDELTQGTT